MHSDLRVVSPDKCVLRNVLEHWARERPGDVCVKLDDESETTYAEFRDLVVRTAIGLRNAGVRQGQHVLVWLPNELDVLRVWFAINYLGAVYTPMNIGYKGSLLAHAIDLSDATHIVLHGALAPRLDEVAKAKLHTAIVLGPHQVRLDGLKVLGADALSPPSGPLPELERPIAPWDTQSIIFTSGTTGPSKAVLSSYMHLTALCGQTTWTWLKQEDRFLITLPMFHIGGTCLVYAMLLRGGSIGMTDAFVTETFWQTVRRTRSTAVALMGVMAPFLLKAPPSDADRNHGLRLAVIIPLGGAVEEFVRRFKVEVYTVFNMTEISTPLISERNPTLLGTSGQPRAGVQVRLVDENDCEVPIETVGEMILRTDAPWAMNHGYYKNPEATAQAWRNGWFHTGDVFRRDAEGNFFFVDRLKDVIRRRGENISSFEVEAEVLAHPLVREAAAIPVANELSEDEVMVVVALVNGVRLDMPEFINFLVARMPHYMVPRYVRIVPELPKTLTAKVQKNVLKQEAVTHDTFDCVNAGIVIRRERLASTRAR